MRARAMHIGWVVAGVLLLTASPADAVPSFARQTGMACEACHTVFPELTHFGRMFKANGYTLDNLKQVRGITAAKDEMLALSQVPPISAMAQIAYTSTKTKLPDSTGASGVAQNGTISFPEAASLFYAGKIAPQLGGFIQLTYDNAANKIHIDNTDIRYAGHIDLAGDRDLIFGVTVNNNPTVQDVWNTTPAFGYPYATSNATITPLAKTQIDGTLAQSVAGAGAYLFWNEGLYAEVSFYRSAKQGFTNPLTGSAGPLDGTATNVITGTTPYGRVAYEYQWDRNSLAVGLYGLDVKMFPGGGVPLNGPTNRFRDWGIDAQYQYVGDDHLVTLAGTRIHEKMTLDASTLAGTNPTDDLTTLRLWGTYYYQRKYGATVAYFSTTGSTDPGLYPPTNPAGAAQVGAITSANGSPDTKGWILELNYVPWLNTKFSFQYTWYTKFNGGSSNYDGFGRNAKDNDTLFLLGWVSF